MAIWKTRPRSVNPLQGAPNFACDPKLIDDLAEAMRAGYNQYAPMACIAALREALSRKIARRHGTRYSAEDEITAIAASAVLKGCTKFDQVHSSDPVDEVVYFEPAFDSYAPIVRLQGATPVPIKLSPRNFRFEWTGGRRLALAADTNDHRDQHPA